MAHALHGKGTMTVGLVTGFGLMEIWVRAIASFEQTARENGYLVLTAVTQDDPTLEDRVLEEMMDRHVDALAVYPTATGSHEKLRALALAGYPVLTFDSAGRMGFPIDDVSIDQFHGGWLQAKHLASIGRRRVCHVNLAERQYVNDLKTAGLEAGAREFGIEIVHRMDLRRPWTNWASTRPNICDEIRDHLAAHRGEFDSLATLGDVLAMQAIRAAAELNIRVPQDLSVIGFNDVLAAGLMLPALTTIADPAEEMGRVAVDMLLERLTGGRSAAKPRRVKLAPELRVRDSTARSVD
jgi:LacI family transcriptional regulator